MQKQPIANQSKQKTPNNFRIQRKDKDLSLWDFYLYSEEFCDNKPAFSKYGILVLSSLTQAGPEIRHFASQWRQKLLST